ncbi:MAG: CapA family protein [Gammaproteobacteria bacterium]|nr:CapA family protein [Gammaproteobacteria bacterium]
MLGGFRGLNQKENHLRHVKNWLALSVASVLAGCSGSPGDTTDDRDGINMAIVGQAIIEHDPRQYLDAPLQSVVPIVGRSDVVFTNLEVAIAGAGCPCQPTRNDVFFHGAPPVVLDYLAELGVSLLSLANNHSWDYGSAGILSTIEEVDARGLVHSGTGTDVTDATAPAYLEVGGLTLSLISTASVNSPDEARATESRPGVNMLDPLSTADWERNLASIRDADPTSDIVVVYHHFQTDAEPGWQQSWARATIDAGADIYVSHGEPVLAGVEVYRDRLILYGLANFIFQSRTEPGYYPAETWESVVAEVSIDADGLDGVVFTPIVLDPGEPGPLFFERRGFPEVAGGELGQSILQRLVDRSEPYGTALELEQGRATLRIRDDSE